MMPRILKVEERWELMRVNEMLNFAAWDRERYWIMTRAVGLE